MTKTRFALFSWTVLASVLLVILWGAFVRATGSGAGCGSHWPMCNGEVIPRPRSIETIIEFTHRLTSGLSGVLVVAQVAWVRRAFAPGHRVRRAAHAGLLLMLTEALIGAAIVKLRMVADNPSLARAGWTAAHLTNTFLLVAALTLAAYWASGGKPVAIGGRRGVAVAGALALLGTLVLGVTGAITALGDTLFPARTLLEGMAQDLSPTAHFLLRLRFLHPVFALGMAVYVFSVGSLLGSGGATEEVRKLAMLVGGLFAAQVGLGFLNLALLAPVATQILHLLAADLVWISLVSLVASSLAVRSATSEAPLAAVERGAYDPS